MKRLMLAGALMLAAGCGKEATAPAEVPETPLKIDPSAFQQTGVGMAPKGVPVPIDSGKLNLLKGQ